MNPDNPTRPVLVTARELLADTAGEAHQEHTVVKRSKAVGGSITFFCSCGIVCEVADTKENEKALALVPPGELA